MFPFKSPLLLLPLFLLFLQVQIRHCLQSQLQSDVDPDRLAELLDKCIDSKNHKKESGPGPEDELHGQCTPWKSRSCCTHNTTKDLHFKKMYNFDWDHCAWKKPMSDKCRSHFVQDLCFYECSPNVGPWVVQVKNSFRSERFLHVPLCLSECERWFSDCSGDFTCTDNWPQNMKWIKGLGNLCPEGSRCQTYKEIYQNAKNFCETVWDHSFQVVEDSQPCMKIWFDPKEGNPNDAVARAKAIQILKETKNYSAGSGRNTLNSILYVLALASIVIAAN